MATNAHKRVDENLRQQIITTCGDADVRWGTKHIDPALCMYVDAYLMCIDNKHLKDKSPKRKWYFMQSSWCETQAQSTKL